jgi:hypothetical protein
LNANTGDRFSFFGIEIQVLQIDDSALAPDFHVVAKPNDWSRGVGNRIKTIESAAANPLRQLYLDYWSGLHDYLAQHEHMAKVPKPSTHQWMVFAIGRANFALSAAFQREIKRIRVELWMNDPKKIAFKKLESEKQEIGQEIKLPLSWEEMPEKRTSRIAVYRDGVDIGDRDTWESQFQWYAEQLRTFRRVFSTRVRALDLGDDDVTPSES